MSFMDVLASGKYGDEWAAVGGESVWRDYTESQSSSMYQAPNSASVPVNRPSVDTGGVNWEGWFDRLVGTAVAVRNSSRTDAQITSYPGSGFAYAGQPTEQGNSMFPLLMLAGLGLAAYFLMKS